MPRFPHVTWTVVLAAGLLAHPAAAAARWRGCLVRRARAEILEGPGKAAGRLAELTRAVADARAVWGDRHPETARCEVELARAALAAEKPIDADKALDRALPVLAAAPGGEHPD